MTKWSPIHAVGGMKHGSSPTAVRAGDLVWLSSIRGVDPETQKPLADPAAQYRQAFENARIVLEEAGGSMADVIRVAAYMKDLYGDRDVLNDAWAEAFPPPGPARMTLQVSDMGAEGDDSRVLLDIVAYL